MVGGGRPYFLAKARQPPIVRIFRIPPGSAGVPARTDRQQALRISLYLDIVNKSPCRSAKKYGRTRGALVAIDRVVIDLGR